MANNISNTIVGKNVKLKGTIANMRPAGVTQSGRPFMGFTLVCLKQSQDKDGRTTIAWQRVSVTAWAEKVSLLQSLDLRDGQSVEIAGFLKPNTYTDKHGIARTGEDLTLDALTY